MTANLRVGIIGVHAERGWARESHAPAVRAIDGLDLAGVAGRDAAAAERAAAAVGAERAYRNPAELIADPTIDVVTVATAVPAHRELILAAAGAGKHVVTEWPVGVSAEETAEIEAATRSVHTAVGLQARRSPAAVRAAELIAAGRIGRVTAIDVLSTTAAFGPVLGERDAPLELPATGMNLRTIHTAHTLDLAGHLGGGLGELSATGTIQFPHPVVEGAEAEVAASGTAGGVQITGRDAAGRPAITRALPDRIHVTGSTRTGASLSAEVVGGRPVPFAPFRLTVLGEAGTIELVGGAPRGFQTSVLRLLVDGVEEQVDASAPDLGASAVNVAGVYAALRDDIRSGATGAAATAPGFDAALDLARRIDALLD
jgi:predicted dehydrogenase